MPGFRSQVHHQQSRWSAGDADVEADALHHFWIWSGSVAAWCFQAVIVRDGTLRLGATGAHHSALAEALRVGGGLTGVVLLALDFVGG